MNVNIKKVQFEECIKKIFSDNSHLYFWTLTTEEVNTIFEIREKWRNLRHYLREYFGKDFKYIQNYEVHPNGHGWHIHVIFNKFISWKKFGRVIQNNGFHRCSFEKIYSKNCADYMCKHIYKAYNITQESLGKHRIRLVNMSRGLPRYFDYQETSDIKSRKAEFFKVYKNSNKFKIAIQKAHIVGTFGFKSLKEFQDYYVDFRKKVLKKNY